VKGVKEGEEHEENGENKETEEEEVAVGRGSGRAARHKRRCHFLCKCSDLYNPAWETPRNTTKCTTETNKSTDRVNEKNPTK